jgi:hypothetical protein
LAITKFDVITNACTLLGAEKVSSFDDETREAEVAEALYELNITFEMSLGFWNFCKKTTELSQDVTAPTDLSWTYQYQQPSDILQVMGATDGNGNKVDYEVEGDKIFSDANRLILKYIYRPDESKWPVYFRNVAAHLLAWKFAEALIAESGVRDRSRADYEAARRDARRIDASATPPTSIVNVNFSPWLSSRDGY